METLPTHISTTDSQFQANAGHHRALAQELRQQMESVRQGGGKKQRQRQEEQGKLFVRERIERLLDPGAPFLELSALAAHGLYQGDAPGAGIVTGIGRVSGREVLIVVSTWAWRLIGKFPFYRSLRWSISPHTSLSCNPSSCWQMPGNFIGCLPVL